MLIVLARLKAQNPILDHVRPAHAMLAAYFVEPVDQFHAVHRVAVQRNGNALFESDLHNLRGLARAGAS